MSIIKKTYEKIFGSHNEQILKEYRLRIEQINNFEAPFEKLTVQELQGKTQEFKNRLKEGESLDDILPEAFATVREAGKRLMGMRHYDVQMIGGMTIHAGKIAEMRTGEGKTLVATLPIYLNALEGKGAHVITVNDYLAMRDAVWMGQIYDFLGLSVGIIQGQRISYIYDKDAKANPETQEGSDIDKERDELGSVKVEYDYLKPASRKEAYQCDITYGTNNEFGFDYLRDNMVQDISDMVMRPGEEMHFAVIDEIDSILIDEARTPLIISAPAEEAADQYYQFARLVKQLQENEDYNIDEKLRSATLTEEGISKFEQWLGIENIYATGGIRIVHHIEQALKAEMLFKRDKDYVIEEGQVVIIDEFTGRKMPGRRYSQGLHQALEAKENVPIQRESRTLATITFQNLFRMYRKLAGMTGTAITEEEEFHMIYGLDVVVIPTNKPDARVDRPDRIYRNDHAKYDAIVKQIKECKAKGQPILIGTISVEKNEELSQFLTAQGVEHEILNAKNHEREGEIIAQAGRPSAVTLATNIAGRGVDIKLGGFPVDKEDEQKVINAGGLFVLGSERHESRRIDNQLRGRSARQGDPGETQFYVCTDDDLMRIFAGDRLKALMTRLNVPEDMPIEQRTITRMLEGAQRKVEGHNFDIRKHLLEYDDILNKQRHVIYKQRREILDISDKQEVKEKTTQQIIKEYIEQEIEFVVSFHTTTLPEKNKEGEDDGWNMKEIFETMRTIMSFSNEERDTLLHMGTGGEQKMDDVEAREDIITFLSKKADAEYQHITESIINATGGEEEKGKQVVRAVEKGILLRAFDALWVEYLVEIDRLRKGIGLRGYGQRDPLIEYKKETYHMFNALLANIQKEVVYSFYKVGTGIQLAPSVMATDKMTLQGAQKSTSAQGQHIEKKQRNEEGNKVGRNDPCPCGSGKKYKKCHGRE
ncbi:MAG: preprotein translocase subunit SecA [Candidatus Magasanikbacteria bacterium]|nr:preprotein translocase subunit SecA [Candidatus Magasanikbacteria bacterium]NCS71662.1 preprotein translocase subunit SecA [Candidatus Magasanikbacteria bacterium]